MVVLDVRCQQRHPGLRKVDPMLRCYGDGCPLRADCYRATNPAPGRDAFGRLPYDPVSGACEYFVTNLPTEAQIRDSAYFIWLRAGRPSGREDDHWEEARRSWLASLGRED
jgi:hypothetical protein